MAIRKQSVIENPMEAVRQNVKEKATDEFTRLEGRDLPGAAAIPAAEADVATVHSEQPIVGDRDAVRVARKIGQHPFGTGEGLFGINDPVGSARWRESVGKWRYGCGGSAKKEVVDDEETASAEPAPETKPAAKKPATKKRR